MKFDITLKEIFQSLPQRLLQMLCGSEITELLTVEQPSVKMRKPDFVARLKNGRIFHLEIQSDDDANMPWRMLEYYPPIRREYGQPPVQAVLYVGDAPLNIASKIEEDRLSFSYDVIDISEFDSEPLIESDSPADNLIAILCHVDDIREVSQRILDKLSKLPNKEAKDAATKLLILSNLRGSQNIVAEEVKRTMQITREDLIGIPIISDAILLAEELAEERGEKSLLLKQLKSRFGPLPAWAEEKIAAADTDMLEIWGLRLLEAKSLEEVFRQEDSNKVS